MAGEITQPNEMRARINQWRAETHRINFILLFSFAWNANPQHTPQMKLNPLQILFAPVSPRRLNVQT